MDIKHILNNLSEQEIFNRERLLEVIRKSNTKFSKNSIGWLLNQMEKEQLIYRVGHGKYQLLSDSKKIKVYKYMPSDRLQEIIKILSEGFPLIEFQAWESIQLNKFLNHQIVHNTIFVEVERMMEDAVFENLRTNFKEKVLLKPDKKTFTIYDEGSTIVVLNLITESPRDKKNNHKILLEKLLVDLIANKILNQIISNSEFSHIYEDAFERYLVDESKLFRYAKRRNADKKIEDLLKTKKIV